MKKTILAKLNHDLKIAIMTGLIFQFVLLIVGLTIAKIKQTELINYNFNWDSVWYEDIINHAYLGTTDRNIYSVVFYPLFPLIIAVLRFLTFKLIPIQILGTVLNTICLIVAVYYLRKICHDFAPNRKKFPFFATMFLLTFHSSFFLHCFYTEALLLSLGLASYYFATKRKWGIMALLLAFTTAVRLPGLLFVGLCGLEYMRAYGYKIKKIFNKNLLWFLLAPAGLFLYMAYLWATRGDPFAMFHAYQGSVWGTYQVFNLNIFNVYYEYFINLITQLRNGKILPATVDYFLPLYSIGMILLSSLYVFFKKQKELFPLAVFGLAAIVMFSLNSNLVSVNRYAISVVSEFIIFGYFATEDKKRWRKVMLITVSAINLVISLVAYYGFITSEFVG